MKEDTSKSKWVYIIGIIPVIWLALLVAPYLYGGGLSSILKGMTKALKEPFDIELCANSLNHLKRTIVGVKNTALQNGALQE